MTFSECVRHFDFYGSDVRNLRAAAKAWDAAVPSYYSDHDGEDIKPRYVSHFNVFKIKVYLHHALKTHFQIKC